MTASRSEAEGDAVGERTSRGDALLLRVGWVPIACVIGLLVLIGVAGITWQTSPYWGRSNVQAPARNVGSIPVAAPATASPVAPNRIVIPKLEAQAPIVSVATTANDELEIPVNPKIAGWWSPGAKPGAKRGTAVIAGHINYSGVPGALGQIGKLDPGDVVYVYGTQNAERKARVKFRVTGVRSYPKTRLPYQQIFDQRVAGRLAIVTCGGRFDASTGNYLENIVVYAVLA